MLENRRNIEKSIDCWGNWIRQHKKTLSRLCGYHTAGIREKYYLRRADVYIDLRKKNDEEYLRDEEE